MLSFDPPATASTKKVLQAFRGSVQRRINGAALNFAATPMLSAARRLAPDDSGALKASMAKIRKAYHYAGQVMVIVGPDRHFIRYHKGKKRRPANYAHLVELGTSKTTARPFMRPAFDTTKFIAERRYLQKLRQGVKKETAKLARKPRRL
jgi:HK97 gp10 family phage protein